MDNQLFPEFLFGEFRFRMRLQDNFFAGIERYRVVAPAACRIAEFGENKERKLSGGERNFETGAGLPDLRFYLRNGKSGHFVRDGEELVPQHLRSGFETKLEESVFRIAAIRNLCGEGGALSGDFQFFRKYVFRFPAEGMEQQMQSARDAVRSVIDKTDREHAVPFFTAVRRSGAKKRFAA